MAPDPVFHAKALLKRDLMGTVESGVLDHPTLGPIPAILRSRHGSPLWVRPISWALARREEKALRLLDAMPGVPALLATCPAGLVRSFIPGRTLAEAAPRDPVFYAEGRRLLRAIHRRGVTHNDTHKEANWLVTDDGLPALVDYQLASRHQSRGAWWRLCRAEDLRHLLKHKRTHCAGALTGRERALLATKSWPARSWQVLIKPIYLLVTRRLLRWRDREGRGPVR